MWRSLLSLPLSLFSFCSLHLIVCLEGTVIWEVLRDKSSERRLCSSAQMRSDESVNQGYVCSSAYPIVSLVDDR
ncbi:Hypothetical protein NTJ_03210 [Nesidiocoris tenuis]|uniref:Secreted protein n=1 Tax=Nesidiocoris tenuis TaxID=355587 RepID=A0ABN7ADM7_9HEMI|nr:Hypothetical protein NTJ_03210 [Nesidiocoris tenuis]